MEWQPIETLPPNQEALVCVTYSLGGDDAEWETEMWVDTYVEGHGWFAYPHMIWIPAEPTRWMPLPPPPNAAKPPQEPAV